MIDPVQNIPYSYAYIPAMAGPQSVSPNHSLTGAHGATSETQPADAVDTVEISTLYSGSATVTRLPIMGSGETSNYSPPKQGKENSQPTVSSGNSEGSEELAETPENAESADGTESAPRKGTEKEGASASAGADEDKAADGSDLSEEEQQQVAELKARDQEVRIHEQAHIAAGAGYASGASYSYQRGPDGNSYAIGGEVNIDTSTTGDPERDIAKMRIVRSAALAPASPSGQDMSVAAAASQAEAEANRQASEQQLEESQQQREEAAAAAEEREAEQAGEPGATDENESAAAGASAASPTGSPDAAEATGEDANTTAPTNPASSPEETTANGSGAMLEELVSADAAESVQQTATENTERQTAATRQARAAYGQSGNLVRGLGIDLVA